MINYKTTWIRSCNKGILILLTDSSVNASAMPQELYGQ